MLNQPGTRQHLLRLNESPSKKEGKCGGFVCAVKIYLQPQ